VTTCLTTLTTCFTRLTMCFTRLTRCAARIRQLHDGFVQLLELNAEFTHGNMDPRPLMHQQIGLIVLQRMKSRGEAPEILGNTW